MNKKLHYGYLVALICFVIAFFYVGHANNTGSLYVVPVTSFYGFSRAEFSIIFSIISIITIIANLAFVKVYRHIGIKKTVVLGAFCCASAFLYIINQLNCCISTWEHFYSESGIPTQI